MDFLSWMAIAGGLLLLMALSSAYISRLPVSTSAIYLLVGIALSPIGFNLLRINVIESKDWFEHLTTVAVTVSLFIGGLKLRLPLLDPAWSAAYRLAGPVMLFSILGVAAFAHLVFGLNFGVSLLLGAIIAPTDPVLASAVSVNNAKDKDRMRYGLSGEAGLNDGAAFPFVIFGLLWLENAGAGNWIGGWVLQRILWAIPAGLLIGYLLGKGVGRFAIRLRKLHKDAEAPNDFLALSLIALSYVGAEYIGAWGFLAAFAAGVGLRHAEIKIVEDNPLPDSETNTEDSQAPHPPAEEVVGENIDKDELQKPAVAAGVVVSEIISFGDTAERILEVLLVVLVGICVASHWDWRAVPLALAFFFVIRPLFAQLSLIKTPTGNVQRWLLGWFGIRGIGSLYYLSYALNHGLTTEAEDAAALTISIVAISIVLHGITATPILNYYERQIAEKSK